MSAASLQAFAEEADARVDLEGDAFADEELARAGARHRGAAIVGIGARADQRRIADPAPALAGDPAGRGRGGDVPRLVERHRADRAVFHVDVELAAIGEQFVELAAAFGNREPVGIGLFQPVLAR